MASFLSSECTIVFPNCMSRAVALLNKQEDERKAVKGESESNTA